MFVAFTLNSVLASCDSWRFTSRSHKWVVKAAALRVLHASLATPLAPQTPADTSRGGYEPDWSLARAVAEVLSGPGAPAGYLFVNLPPPAGKHKCLLYIVIIIVKGLPANARCLLGMANSVGTNKH